MPLNRHFSPFFTYPTVKNRIIHEIGLKENRVYIIGKSEGVCYNYTEVKRRMLSMKNAGL